LARAPTHPVEVEVVLQDILLQGGLIYPVESVTVERVWYCTCLEMASMSPSSLSSNGANKS
jgi:hypothetical protein